MKIKRSQWLPSLSAANSAAPDQLFPTQSAASTASTEPESVPSWSPQAAKTIPAQSFPTVSAAASGSVESESVQFDSVQAAKRSAQWFPTSSAARSVDSSSQDTAKPSVPTHDADESELHLVLQRGRCSGKFFVTMP